MEVFVAIPEVIDDERFERKAQVFERLLKFGVIFGFYALAPGDGHDRIRKFGRHVIILDELMNIRILCFQVGAVAVYVAQRLIVDIVAAAQGHIIFCIGCRVQGHEDVGHNPTTTVDGTALVERMIDLRRIEVDAIDRNQLTVLKAILKVFFIFRLATLRIRLLNAASGGRIIMSHG